MNFDDGFIWWDKGFYIMFGVDFEVVEDLFKIWEKCIYLDDELELCEKLEVVLCEGVEYDVEYCIVLDDGCVCYICLQVLLCEGFYGEKVFSGINFDLMFEVCVCEEIECCCKEVEEVNLVKF